jgi:hypothetical protein
MAYTATTALAQSILSVLQRRQGSEHVLLELEGALTADNMRAPGVQALVHVLNSDGPGPLGQRLLSAVPLLHLYKHQKSPDWKLGTFLKRSQLARRLWQHAREVVEQSAQEAEQYARAAFFIALQEPLVAAPAFLHSLLQDVAFEQLTRWPQEVVRQLRSIVESENQRTGQFLAHLEQAAEDLKQMIEHREEQLHLRRLSSFFSAMDEMVVLSPGRPEFQWRIANYVWRLQNLSRSTENGGLVRDALAGAVARWRGVAGSEDFVRWTDEALQRDDPPPRGVGIHFRAAGDLK